MLTKELGFLKDLFLAHAGQTMTKTNYYQIAESFGISYTFVSYYYFYDFCVLLLYMYWNNRYLVLE